MTGARAFAIDFIRKRVGNVGRLLDVGTGDGEIAKIIRDWTKASLTAIDINEAKLPKEPGFSLINAKVVPWTWAPSDHFDIVISTYALHTFNDRESAVWSEIGRVLKVGGKLLVTSNHSLKAPFVSTNRGDPLKVDSNLTLSTLGMSSGMRMVDFKTALYEPHNYTEIAPDQANACGAVFVKDLEQYKSTLPK